MFGLDLPHLYPGRNKGDRYLYLTRLSALPPDELGETPAKAALLAGIVGPMSVAKGISREE